MALSKRGRSHKFYDSDLFLFYMVFRDKIADIHSHKSKIANYSIKNYESKRKSVTLTQLLIECFFLNIDNFALNSEFIGSIFGASKDAPVPIPLP